MSGFYRNTLDTTRTAMQTTVNGLYTASNAIYPPNAWYEKRSNVPHGYTNNSFPTTNTDNTPLEVLTVNFYDGYDFDDSNTTADFSYVNQGLTGESPKFPTSYLGLATGSKRLKLGTTTYLYTYVFYNRRGQVIQVRGDNHLRPGIYDNIATNIYDDEGKLKASKNYHYASGSAVTIRNEYTYDNQGRLLQVKQNNVGATPDQVVAQYEYNELGQLVDKKLHKKTDGTFLQSVDYRYTIRGQLESINNAKLTSDVANNDETNDYFGLEILYNQVETGLNTTATAKFDGNISAMKWKSIGGGTGSADQKSYKYTYDKTGQLKSSNFQMHNGTSWSKEAKTLNEDIKYDHNGNILKLSRRENLRGLGTVNNNPTVTSTPHVIDSLDYRYSVDKLNYVDDLAYDPTGFKDSATSQDYTYDINGNVLTDKNRAISNITYNLLGKPAVINFTDGRKIEYFYDAAGIKLTMKTYPANSATPQTTDYVNSFVYENSALRFFGSPEGRVVKNGSAYEYQYAISDHQGNTRIVFSSVTPADYNPTATFDGGTTDKTSDFSNIPPIFSFPNAAHSGSYVVRMRNDYNLGLTKSLEVFPGDKVDIDIWEYHEGTAGFDNSSPSLGTMITNIAAAFNGSVSGTGESKAIYDGVNAALVNYAPGGNKGSNRPSAYLNYILFDKNYKVLDMGWKLAPDSTFRKQKLSFPTKTIQEAGFMFIYVTYENDASTVPVYFDDLHIKHLKTNVLQYNEYYPYGLETFNSWTRTNVANDFKYNAGSELNKNTGWYETYFRSYDPTLGRFVQVDPLSVSEQATYQYAGNNPVSFNDPLGASRNMRDIDRWALAEEAANAGRVYQQMFSDWGMDSGPSIPGSGDHWSDQYRSVWGNLMMMTESTFRDFYGINDMSDGEKADFALQNGLTTSVGYAIFEEGNPLGGKEGIWTPQTGFVTKVDALAMIRKLGMINLRNTADRNEITVDKWGDIVPMDLEEEEKFGFILQMLAETGNHITMITQSTLLEILGDGHELLNNLNKIYKLGNNIIFDLNNPIRYESEWDRIHIHIFEENRIRFTPSATGITFAFEQGISVYFFESGHYLALTGLRLNQYLGWDPVLQR